MSLEKHFFVKRLHNPGTIDIGMCDKRDHGPIRQGVKMENILYKYYKLTQISLILIQITLSYFLAGNPNTMKQTDTNNAELFRKTQ